MLQLPFLNFVTVGAVRKPVHRKINAKEMRERNQRSVT